MVASPKMRLSPAGSCRISRSGGRSHPVSAGDRARAIQPEGAIRNARPKAAAACGTDRSGDSIRSIAPKARVPAQPAQMSTTSDSDSAVAAKPTPRLSAIARGSPGQAASASNAARLGRCPPSAGM